MDWRSLLKHLVALVRVAAAVSRGLRVGSRVLWVGEATASSGQRGSRWLRPPGMAVFL
jgi:hypothetical protein